MLGAVWLLPVSRFTSPHDADDAGPLSAFTRTPAARRQGALSTTRAKARTPHTFEDVLCQFRASTGISLARTQHVGNPRMRRD